MKTPRFRSRAGLLFLLAGILGALPLGGARAGDGDPSPEQVFRRRILPIFQSPNPSSCTQCHLAGVDLKNYILPSHEKTFLSLRDQGLIDLKNPERSKILALINMQDKERSETALITAKTRRAEYEAFAEWIKASCADPKLRDAPKLEPAERAGPQPPAEVIRHGRKDRLLDSFERNVWSMRFRCMGCHTAATPQGDKNAKEHGEGMLWLKAEGAEAAMTSLIRSGRLINTKEPEQSLLLLKPLMEVKHGGGKKFQKGDLGYQAFRSWLEDYAAVVNGKYARAEDLPDEAAVERFGTDAWLKLDQTPPEWGDKLLRVEVYAWDARQKTWEGEPIAVSDRGVWGKGRLWQHNVVLLAAKGSARAAAWKKEKPALPPGRYLVKVYVDGKDRLAKDWKAELGAEDFVGKAEFESRWPEGYGQMTVLDAARVRP
jgi:hypothetical protein